MKMRPMLLVLSLLLINPAHAAPWNADCVTFWGKAIPVAERTIENCPTGRSHWDKSNDNSNGIYGIRSTVPVVANGSLNPSLPTTVLTPSGGVLIVPNYSGGAYPAAIIQISD